MSKRDEFYPNAAMIIVGKTLSKFHMFFSVDFHLNRNLFVISNVLLSWFHGFVAPDVFLKTKISIFDRR